MSSFCELFFNDGYKVVAPRKLAGADDLCTAQAANLQPAPAGCRMGTHRKLAGVDDLYTALAANLNQ
jgi:hypothetical protein